MPQEISLSYLQTLLFPLGFKLDQEQEYPVFWKKVAQKDIRSVYAFSIITATLHQYSFRLEGLNENRLMKQIRAGKIVLESEEDIEQMREVLFETTLDDAGRLEPTLNFLLQQLSVLETEPMHSEIYKQALKHIELMVAAANQVDLD